MFYDTHAHVEGWVGDGSLAAVLGRAAAAGVGRLVAVGGTATANVAVLEAAGRHSAVVRAAVGYDRDEAATRAGSAAAADGAAREIEALIHRAAGAPGVVVAIGETGLDYHYHPETAVQQRRLFEAQLALARRVGLPVVVHSREAEADTLEALGTHAREWRDSGRCPGVLHCFTGEAGFARRVLDTGMCVSFSGIVTFRNALSVREAARMVPDDRLLLETDSPYLAPVPLRGQPNEPAHVVHVARVVAEVRGVAVERLTEITTANALALFGG